LDGSPCLVSCPIDIYSTARIIPADGYQPDPEHHKMEQAVRQMEILVNRRIEVQVTNPLPVGRGFGTSTADIGAAISIIAHSLNLTMPAEAASQVAVHIEPTDSTFFPGLSLYDHRRGQFNLPLGPAPEASILILDAGEAVDGDEFNAFDWQRTLEPFSTRHRAAFEMLKAGIESGDLEAVAEASTLSARIHQDIRAHPLLETALGIGKSLGALGLCRAHNGTILGLLFPPEYDCQEPLEVLRREFPDTVQIQLAHLTGGGPTFLPSAD
jgi:L-threonine kinase